VTSKETNFVNRLKRLIRDMPESLELLVRHGHIAVCQTGARETFFNAHGDADNTPDLITVDTYRSRIYPNGESL